MRKSRLEVKSRSHCFSLRCIPLLLTSRKLTRSQLKRWPFHKKFVLWYKLKDQIMLPAEKLTRARGPVQVKMEWVQKWCWKLTAFRWLWSERACGILWRFSCWIVRWRRVTIAACKWIVVESKIGPVMSSLTPVELLEGGRHRCSLLGVTSVGTPMERVWNVMFADEESDVNPVAKVISAELSRPDLGSSRKTMASVEGASTDLGSSIIDALIMQGTSTGQIGPTGFPSRNMHVEMREPEETAALKRFSQRSKFTLVSRRKLC